MSIKPIRISSFWEEKKPKRKLDKNMRYAVWNKYIGPDKAEGKCFVCHKTIHIQDFEVGITKQKVKVEQTIFTI